MERLKVSQVAKILGITPTAVYKKFKTCSELIQNHIHKEKGVTFIDQEGFEILRATMQKAPFGNEEPCKIEPVHNLVETLQKELDRKQEIIESLIAQNEEQRKRTDTILMKLTSDISSLQKSLEYKKYDVNMQNLEKKSVISSESQTIRADRCGVIHLKSENLKDSLDSLPWFERFYIKTFHPERLRRFNS